MILWRSGSARCLLGRALRLRLPPEAAETWSLGPSIEEIHRPPAQFFMPADCAGVRLFLVGDAAPFVPPDRGEGLEPCGSDVHYLSRL